MARRVGSLPAERIRPDGGHRPGPVSRQHRLGFQRYRGCGAAAGRARILGVVHFHDRIGLRSRCRPAEHVTGAGGKEQAHAKQQAPRRMRAPAEQGKARRHACAGKRLALARHGALLAPQPQRRAVAWMRQQALLELRRAAREAAHREDQEDGGRHDWQQCADHPEADHQPAQREPEPAHQRCTCGRASRIRRIPLRRGDARCGTQRRLHRSPAGPARHSAAPRPAQR